MMTTMRPAAMSARISSMLLSGSCGLRIQTLYVARQQIDFEIDARAGLERAERGHFERVRDEVDRRNSRPSHFVDGEAHAIERHRTLARDVTRQRLRRRELDAQRARIGRRGEDFGDAIDVPGNPVTAEAVAGAQRWLRDSRARRRDLAPSVVTRSVSPDTSAKNSSLPSSATVRQTPSTQMLAPSASRSRAIWP